MGKAIRDELRYSAPRMLKHAEQKQSNVSGLTQDFQHLVTEAKAKTPKFLTDSSASIASAPTAHLEIGIPPGDTETGLVDALRFHDNRYAWIGDSLKRTHVRFGWDAVALAEIRDLNRHRTGTKFCPLQPLGFYAAFDQLPDQEKETFGPNLESINEIGRKTSAFGHSYLAAGDPTYIYWTLLGTQYRFEHITTADKFIYEAELRTGTGAHFRYAKHLRDVLLLWYEQFPNTKALILEGSAEPE